ncbi:Ig-like domain-containing protein [Paenibacillus sp. FSL R5-0623]|uniref:Ig-like domain-containing protein n=1 Tax=Paenibacillus sp. FSL R5-0623 TaxID=2921651 RepID=UPI0030DD3CBF
MIFGKRIGSFILVLSLITGLLYLKPSDKVYAAAPTSTITMDNTLLRIGSTSQVTFTFSEAVQGLDNGDLTVPNATLTAPSSSDGGTTWTATLTPKPDTTDALNVITLDNSGVMNQDRTVGVGITTSSNYAIDTIRPTANIIIAGTVLTAGQTSLVTITFSEAVTGFDVADLLVENGTVSDLSSSNGGITWTATLTPAYGITDETNIITLDNTGMSNDVGNAGIGTTISNNYEVYTARPTATIVVADTTLIIGKTSQVTITFSEPVTGFTVADLAAMNGTINNLATNDNIIYTAELTPTVGMTAGTNKITLDNTGVMNQGGITGTGTTDSNNYAIDTVRPTATIDVTDTTMTAGKTSQVNFTFSEGVTGFTNDDLTVANGTLSAVSSSNGGITWTATLTPAVGTTDGTNIITLDNTGISDVAGNAGTGTTDSNNYTVYTAQPTATIVVADTTLTSGKTSAVTITFSEAVSGFDNADLTVASGTLSAVQSSDGGVTWTATLTPQGNVNKSVNVITLQNNGVSNGAGNAGQGITESNPYSVFTVQPVQTTSPSTPSAPMAPIDNTVTSTTGKITVPVGKSGLVSLGKEIQISIPAGGSSQELTLSIDKVSNTEILLTNKEILASPVFELLKNFPENFLKPVKMTFTFDSSGLESHHSTAVYYYNEVNKAWEKVDGGIIKGNQIIVEVNHFTKYAVLVIDKISGKPVLNNPVEPTTEPGFSDISGHWAEARIKQASSKGIINGYPDGTFNPGKNITRAEFSVMLMGALSSQKAELELVFSDKTEIGTWAKMAVSQAVQEGIISGYPDDTFRPNTNITRAEMVVMVANAIKVSITGNATTSFADDKSIPVWAKTSVEALKELGLVEGMGNNDFKPKAQTTRAEAVVILMNMIDKTKAE